METWNQRLAKALDESTYNANSLAMAMGVSAPSMAAWIGAAAIRPARDIKAENLLKVCELLGVRPEWVLTGRLPKKRESASWPFPSVDRQDFEELPERERARIERFMRDTIDDWKSDGRQEVRAAS